MAGEAHDHGQGDRLEKGVARLRREDDCAHEEQPILIRRFKRSRRVPTRSREMYFRSLHHHSTYSYLDGFQLPEAHVRRAAELGMPALALTEHGNVSSHVKLELAAKAAGIKPIFGVELYCGNVGEDAKQRKNHLTILAETQQGYSNLLQLVSRTYSEGFYYEPTCSGPMLSAHRNGLVVLSGCNSSLLATSLIGGKNIEPGSEGYSRGKRVAQSFSRTFGDRYWMEVQAFPELESTVRLNKMIAQISRETGIPMVASFDCHYTVPEESEIQAVLHNVRGGNRQTLEEQSRNWGYDVDLCPPWTDGMALRKLVATGLTPAEARAAIMATVDIADACNVEIPSLPMLRFPVSGGGTAVSLWRQLMKEGWERRGCDRLSATDQALYREQLEHEMKVIEDKDYVDYFLIVADIVQHAKEHGVLVGPARGSAAASLACWLLRITEVNPMLYPKLIFERFIDPNRDDLPDIDLDFASESRHVIDSYAISKYGRECVNKIGTFTKYKNKLALDDVARVYHIPKFKMEAIKDVLIERSSGDLRASATIEDTVEQFEAARSVFEEYPDLVIAMELEGNVKAMGVHAAGLVISAGPVTDTCAVYEREVKGVLHKVISIDKYDCEYKNLLKIDLLGLKNMDFANACRLEMGWSMDELYNLDLNDDLALDGFYRNDVVGIFQFDGRACRYVCGALQPETFDHICDITALARPGPLHNGAANAYVDIKQGSASPLLVHPAVDDITKSTYFQIVYQEQILRIVRDIGGFDWTHAAEIRRIMSKKTGEQAFNRKQEEFLTGAATLHERTDWPEIDPTTARSLWLDLITAGAYAFNAAHSYSYGIIGVWTMWFKQHHPELFYEKALRYMAATKHNDLMRDAVRGHGPRKSIEIRPPHARLSSRTWQRDADGGVRAGWEQFTGVAEKTADAIEAYRVDHEIETWNDLINIKGIGPKTIVKIEEFVNSDDPFGALYIDRAIAKIKDEILNGDLAGVLPAPTHVSADLPYGRGEDIEVCWLGMVKTRNVRDLFEFNQAKGKVLDMKALTIDGKAIKDPHLNEWMVMVGDDESDQMGLLCDRWRYPALRSQLWDMRLGIDLLLVRGIKPGWMPTRQIKISELWVIDPEMEGS